MNDLLTGALAGLTATVPMTMTMGALHRRLPRGEQYPQDPYLVTQHVVDRLGLKGRLDREQRERLALLCHFGYGTMMGALYGMVGRRLPLPGVLGGLALGLLVFAGSYLAWLPTTGLMPPATRYPAGRQGLLIAAHAVWGMTTGVIADELARNEAS